MKLMTARFGEVNIDEEKIIDMPHGMLGFQDKKKYVIFEHKENSPFCWYQSLDDPALAFVITSPFLFVPDYDVDMESIKIEMSWVEEKRDDPIEVYIIVNIPQGVPEKMTANLIGPILINSKIRQAVQMVIADSPYSHKFPLVKQN